MKKYILLLMTSILLMNPMKVMAQEDTTVLPSGITGAEIEDNIDQYVQDNESTTAAVSVAVFNREEVLFQKDYGMMDIENGLKADQDSVYEWGSNTKIIVWTCVMQLVEQGKLDLNEDIRTYLPEGFLTKLSYDTPITMLHLMNHNAGWQETVTDLFFENQADMKSLEEVLKEIEPEQVHEPGTVVSYSNWGAALAGYIVECISGQSFDDYVHQHIFQPLGMEHTALNADLSDNTWVMNKRAQEKCYTIDQTSLGTCHYYLPLYPAGGATGTLSDFIKFAKAFLPAEGEISPLFQKSETLDEMLSPSMYFADGVTPRNCHGFWTDQLGVPVIFHDGGTLGSTSWFAIDLKSGTGVVILTNQLQEYIYTCGILPKIFGDMKYTIDNNQKQDISGMYVSARTCFQGYSKLFSLMSTMQLVSDDQGGYTVPGSQNKFISIGKNSYVMDMDGKQFLVQPSELKDGTPVLQFIGTDFIQINGYGVIAEWILLLLFAVVTLISVVTLVIHIIQAIRHKSKPLLGARITLKIAIILSFAMFAYISLRLIGGVALYRQVHWAIVVIAACGLVPMGYLILLALNWRKLLCTKKQKLGLILAGAGGLIMTINVIYWNAYMFW